MTDFLAMPCEYRRRARAWKSIDGAPAEFGGFTVTPIGRGRYHGWMVDGNKRFLLKDFTVVRNCDQMFCTACHTAFSWRTGQVVTNGTIHNPHYFEYLRQHGGAVPRNAGDLPCGGLCTAGALRFKLRTASPLPPSSQERRILEFLRIAGHLADHDMHRLAGPFTIHDHADLRLQYLLSEIDLDRWKRVLQQREKKRDKELAVRQVYEMFTAAVAEALRKLLGDTVTVNETEHELTAILAFANDSLTQIAKNFNVTPRLINVFSPPTPGIDRPAG